MDDILSKLGVYDLIGVLYTGIVISVCSWFLNDLYDIVQFEFVDNGINKTVQLLVVSYFLGLIFQEIGSLMCKKVFFPRNKLLLMSMKTDKEEWQLSSSELDELEKLVSSKNDQAADDEQLVSLYNRCKYYHLQNCDTAKIDKDQSISAMSRSLFVYFGIVCIIIGIRFLADPSTILAIGFLISAGLALLMFERFKRFVGIRYVHILRAYLYRSKENHQSSTENE